MDYFAANLTTIFTEVPFLERFQKAKAAGFARVECQFPYAASIEAIKAELEKHQLTLELINFPAGDWGNGERGLAIYPDKIEEFKNSVALGIEYACALGVSKIHCMAGILNNLEGRNIAHGVYLENLTYAAKEMLKYDLTLLIEPLNPFDMPGYFLSNIEDAIRVLDELRLENVMLQFDFYHLQRIQGNLLTTFEEYFDRIGHIQIADVPGRHQPGTGEINYERVLQAVDDRGYKGIIGLEYIPAGRSEDSFTWMFRESLRS